MISRSVLICAKGSARETSATCFLILVGLKFTAVNVILVGLGVRLPLLREIIQRENCRHGTDRNTGTAVNALSGIDVQLRHFIERRASIVISAALCRMDTIHRAHIYTGSVFRPETGLGTDVGHQSPPMHGPYQPSKGAGPAAYKPSVKSENHPADPTQRRSRVLQQFRLCLGPRCPRFRLSNAGSIRAATAQVPLSLPLDASHPGSSWLFPPKPP